MGQRQSLEQLVIGDEVAVMPAGANSPEDVLVVLTVSFLAPAVIRLSDGTIYDPIRGEGLLTTNHITPCTEAHRKALGDRVISRNGSNL